MRINRQILLNIASETVETRVTRDHNIVAAFLHGSLIDDKRDPLLGGTTDIDLVFVHDFDPLQTREITALQEDIHLDILHHTRALYRQARHLRTHPELGPLIYHCKILYDPRHLVDFAQASVRGNYHRADNTLARAKKSLDEARKKWRSLQVTIANAAADVDEISIYLEAIADAANAIAALTSGPLPKRRLMLDFPSRVEAVQQQGLMAGLVGLLGGPTANLETLRAILPAWEAAYKTASVLPGRPLDLHTHRLAYYSQAIQVLLDSSHFTNGLYLYLYTWTAAARQLKADHAALIDPYYLLAEQLGLLGAAFNERLAGLDAFLDLISEVLERWGHAHGV